MSNPVIENIALNILATVNSVVTPTYNQTLVGVRPRAVDFSDVAPVDGKVLIVAGEPRPGVDIAVNDTIEWIHPFALMALVIDPTGTATSIETRYHQVRSDLEKAMMIDVTRGDYARMTKILPPFSFDFSDGITGISVAVEITYRTKESDPYTKM